MRCWDKCFRARTHLMICWIWGESQQLLDQAAWRRRGAAAMSGQGVRTRRGAEPWAAPGVPRGPFFPLGPDEGFGKVFEQWASGKKWWKRRLLGVKISNIEEMHHLVISLMCGASSVKNELWTVVQAKQMYAVFCFLSWKANSSDFFFTASVSIWAKRMCQAVVLLCEQEQGVPFIHDPFYCGAWAEGREKCEVLEQLTVFNILICSEI